MSLFRNVSIQERQPMGIGHCSLMDSGAVTGRIQVAPVARPVILVSKRAPRVQRGGGPATCGEINVRTGRVSLFRNYRPLIFTDIRRF